MGTSTGRNKINSDTGRLPGLEALSFRTWERFPSVTHSFLFFLQRRGHIRHHTFKDGLASLLLLWTTRINRRSGAVRGAASETSSTVLLRALAHWARWQFGLADCNNNYKVRGCSFSSSLLQSCRLTLRGNFLFAMQSNIFRWNKSEGLLDGVGKGRLIWNPDGLYARLRNLLLFLHVPRIWTKSCTDRRGITTGKFQKSYEREYEKSNAPLVLLFQKKKNQIISLWANVLWVALPLVAQKLRLNPAVTAAPLMTTIVDATGLLIYFFIAKYIIGSDLWMACDCILLWGRLRQQHLQSPWKMRIELIW